MAEVDVTRLLTCTDSICTLVREVDATTKKLMKVIEEADGIILAAKRNREAAYAALALAGVRPKAEGSIRVPSRLESQYTAQQSFTEMSLSKACLRVLKDHKGEWLTKSNVEWLVAKGGYKFETEDTGNSVGITLRRLADQEPEVEVQRIRGSKGSTYRYVKAKEGKDDVKDSRTTSKVVEEGW